MKQEIHIDTAKEQLKRINSVLLTPHILIGGLAIQQYDSGRNSKDIDLICDNETVKTLITKLYPTKFYNINQINDDEYRPSYEITHRINKGKIIFFGPKVIEREPYMAMDWEKMIADSMAFTYKNEEYENVRVPSIETLAFTKLLAFTNRVEKNKDKGQQDLTDFINLVNQSYFKINILIDLIRAAHCGEYIHDKVTQITSYNTELWNSALFLDFMKILSPLLERHFTYRDTDVFDDNYENVFGLNQAIEFYDKIADLYDERNTKQIFNTHRKIIGLILEENKENRRLKILDIGGGTGKLIATHFFDKSNIQWNCVDPSEQMLTNFKVNMKSAEIEYHLYKNSVFALPPEIEENQYDIILISCVLTSLPEDPNFKKIITLLSEKGTIIIADIDPCYTQARPFYDFKLENDRVALTPRMVHPLDLISQMIAEKLNLQSVHSIENDKNDKYSFVIQFRK